MHKLQFSKKEFQYGKQCLQFTNLLAYPPQM